MLTTSIQAKLELFFQQSALKRYPKGQIITFANEEPTGVCFLISGIVEQYDITPEGNKLTVNVFKPHAFFPMSWAINRTPNSYFFTALTDVEIKQTNAEDTVAFLKANPDIALDLLSRVYKGTDALLRRLVLAESGIAESRLIFELLIEAYRFGVEADNGAKVVTVRQSVLSERSGLARETVSRELHKLEKEGLISRDKQNIKVHISDLEKKLDLQV